MCGQTDGSLAVVFGGPRPLGWAVPVRQYTMMTMAAQRPPAVSSQHDAVLSTLHSAADVANVSYTLSNVPGRSLDLLLCSLPKAVDL